MHNEAKFSFKRVLITVGVIILLLFGFYVFGRSIWHPIVVKVSGEKSVEDRMAEIISRQPDLSFINPHSVQLVAIKNPGYIDVFLDGAIWERFPLTAMSGGPGPKLQEGDGQIPEGIYQIDSVNPNSSYHLSLRVSYPNEDDKVRSKKLGISKLGGDIYIHGKDASIGCLAIGDKAIERVFYIVNKVGYQKVAVIIAPVDLLNSRLPSRDNDELYKKIQGEMIRVYKKSN
jgi:murein L,D-transpeptidase YafK